MAEEEQTDPTPPTLQFQVTLYPNPVLRKEAPPVETFDQDLADTVRAMFERMYASGGVGLAAPQVGISRRIMVLNATGEPEDEIVLINPRIVDKSGPETLFDEGCLSFPGIYAEVKRPDECTVRAQGLDGEEFEASYAGFPSRIVQHEYDHLEGVLLVDRMSPADKQRHKSALADLVDAYKRSRAAAG